MENKTWENEKLQIIEITIIIYLLLKCKELMLIKIC